MAVGGNLSVKRFIFALAASPLVGGFAWGVMNLPNGWSGLAARLINGVLAAPMFVFVLFARPSRVPSFLYILAAFLVLLWIALRLPKAPKNAA